MRKYKAIQFNMVLNVLKTLMSIIFPLITYPYATRVLLVDNFGKVSYAQSVVSYLTLFAGLGISSYAIREGGIYRNNRENMNRFASEVFSINIITTCLAYLFFGFIIIATPAFYDYRVLIAITSISTVFTTLGVEWINVIFEDYVFITVRSFIFQLLSILLLFILVKTPQDYYWYAGIQVFTNGVIALTNLIHVRKLCRISLVKGLNVKKHLKPILILFSNSLAVSIYCSIDNIMIGLWKGDYYVGIYSVAVKIYTILKQLTAAVYSVTVTRLTEYVSEKEYVSYKKVLNETFNNIIFVIIPITFGMLCVSRQVIVCLAGKEYIDAVMPLRILTVTIFFAVIGGALAYCVNLPFKKEKMNLICTVISAAENFLLNIIAIPLLNVVGAALTTLLSELTVCIVLFFTMRDKWTFFDFRGIITNIVKSTLASIPILVITFAVEHYFNFSTLHEMVMIIPLSVLCFIGISCIVKNQVMYKFINGIIKKKSC